MDRIQCDAQPAVLGGTRGLQIKRLVILEQNLRIEMKQNPNDFSHI